jgi:hypothetical protein
MELKNCPMKKEAMKLMKTVEAWPAVRVWAVWISEGTCRGNMAHITVNSRPRHQNMQCKL